MRPAKIIAVLIPFLTLALTSSWLWMVDGLALPRAVTRREATFGALLILLPQGPCVVHASELTEDQQEQREETLKRLLERRQLMQASRSSNNRQSYLDLSKQRAALYNTTFQGVTCPPNIPCL
jgi:membrane carboxypeptidase/penicillin-binding protein PbpC